LRLTIPASSGIFFALVAVFQNGLQLQRVIQNLRPDVGVRMAGQCRNQDRNGSIVTRKFHNGCLLKIRLNSGIFFGIGGIGGHFSVKIRKQLNWGIARLAVASSS
jgi:hypothetical protein